MARLRKLDLSTLTPAQRKFWKGLRPAPELGPTDTVFKMPNQKPQPRPTRAPSHGNIAEADTPIVELATKAAQWLVEHWPDKVAAVGYATFKAARIAEILQGQFGGPYWENCPLENETTWRAVPTCDLSIGQPPLNLQTPNSKNSLCKYTTSTQDAGNAGFEGTTKANGFFTDDWLKEKQYIFKIPEPKTRSGVRPIFTRHDNTWNVTHQYLNHQPWCSLYKASTAKNIADFKDRSVSVDKIGRYFYWSWKVEQPAVGGSTLTMQRSFTVDALYLSHNFGYDADTAGFCLVQVAPASSRGLYHYGNTSIKTDLITAAQCWVALAQDDEDPDPTKNGFFFEFTNGSGYSYRQISQDTSNQNGNWEIYGTADSEAWMAAGNIQTIAAWNAFFPDDRYPGWPTSVTRHTQSEDGSASAGYGPLKVYGSRAPFSSWGEQQVFMDYYNAAAVGNISVIAWLGQQSGIELANVPGGTPNTYWSGSKGWHRRDAGVPARVLTDCFRVKFSMNGFIISWNWPGTFGSIDWRFGDPYPGLPARPAAPP